MKAFVNDVTFVVESRSHMEQLVTRLQELFKWATIKIKSSKFHSLSIIKGNCREIKFSVDRNANSTIWEKSVKSLGLLLLTALYWSTSLAGPKQTDERWIMVHWFNVTWTKIKFGVIILDYFLNYHGQCKYMRYQLEKLKRWSGWSVNIRKMVGRT